jgi:lipoprotein signal peptidase
VDFIEINLHFWPANPWPTFNIADIFLTVGVATLVLSLLLKN